MRLLDLLRRATPTGQPGRAAQARARSRPGSRPSGAGRGRRTGGSSTTAPRPTRTGKPWSERKRYVWWDAEQRQVDRRTTCPTSWPTSAPDYVPPDGRDGPRTRSRGDDPFIMQADGKGWLFAPAGLADGPLPTHYEPHESPFANPLYGAAGQPGAAACSPRPDNRYNPPAASPGADVFPYVVTTYRLTEHHTAGGMSRVAAVPGRAAAGDVLRGLARELAARARARARRLGDDRHARARRSRRGCWSPSGCAPLRVAGPRRAPGRAAVPLGRPRARHRRRGQRPVPARARPERPHPGGQGGDLRHPARAAARAGAALLRARATTTGARAGITTHDGTDVIDDAGLAGELRRRGPAARWASSPTPRVCIGCKACEVACKEWNDVPEDGLVLHRRCPTTTPASSAPTPGATSRSSSSASRARRPSDARRDGRRRRLPLADVARDVCKHCTHAACLDVCPTGALFRTEFGTVVVQEDVCNGCGYCVPACPFGVIDQREDDGRVWKCTLCYDRLRTAWSRPAPRPARPSRSSSAPLDELRERARRRGRRSCTSAGVDRRAAVRRRPGRRRRRRRRVLPAARRARGLRPAARPGRAPPATCRRCGAPPALRRGRARRGRRRGLRWAAAMTRRRAPMVPSAESDSYYGRPIIKAPVWKPRDRRGTSSPAAWPAPRRCSALARAADRQRPRWRAARAWSRAAGERRQPGRS